MNTNASMTPREIVQELDRHIVGQAAAKRAVAIALRNRWRRMQLDPALRDEVMPKNILMIGPTGVGKTEIARRLAALANAPFIKVEATKFTEVGYVGKDVESIVRDLADMAYKQVREQAKTHVRAQAAERAEERLLDALLPRRRGPGYPIDLGEAESGESDTRRKLRAQLREGALDEREVELETAVNLGVDIAAPPGMEEMGAQLRSMFQNLGGTIGITLVVLTATNLLATLAHLLGAAEDPLGNASGDPTLNRETPHRDIKEKHRHGEIGHQVPDALHRRRHRQARAIECAHQRRIAHLKDPPARHLRDLPQERSIVADRAELLRIGLGHGEHPSSGTSRHHRSDVTSRGSPGCRTR